LNPENKTVILTGASSGIGEATARRFYESGSRIVLVARSADRLHALAVELGEDTDRVLVIPADVSEKGVAQRIVDQTLQRFDSVDILINNAGRGMFAAVSDTDEAELRHLFDVNLFGPLALIQAALPVMKEQEAGVIVNASSIVGQVATPMSGGYCATKFALVGLSDSLRMDLRGSGVKVVTVYPGATATAFAASVLGTTQPRKAPRGFAVQPERVAQAILRGVQRESRDVHVTLMDRLFVTTGRMVPRLTDWLLPHVW